MENLDKRLSFCQSCKRFYINPKCFTGVWIYCGKFCIGIYKCFENDRGAISAYLTRMKERDKKYPKCKEN